MSDGLGEGLEYEPASFDDGSEEMLQASSELDGALGERASVQGSAGQQLRQWLPTVPAADAIDEAEGTADQALAQAENITRDDASKLLAQKQNMLDADANTAARIGQIGDDPALPETGGGETPSQIERDLSGNPSPLKLDDDGNPLPPSRVGTGPHSDGRYTQPEGPQWEELRNAALDRANEMPRPPGIGDPRMAGALRMPDGKIYTGVSSRDINLENYPELKSVIDSVPADKQSQYNWKCAEVHCITQALDDKHQISDLNGAQSSAAQIRGPASAGHGAWREPCAGDKYLLGLLGIGW
jgi:hypothetical protein